MTPLPAPRPGLGYRAVAWLARPALHLARWRINATGMHHVPSRGGAVVAWAHNGHVDMVPIAWAIYDRLDRPVRILAKRELWETRRYRWVLDLVDAVPVDRTSGSQRHRSYEAAVASLRHGDLVLVAPEGTISPSFDLLPFRRGASYMARAAGVPIIPSVSWGTQRLVTAGRPTDWRSGSGIPGEVAFGAPITPDDDVDRTTRRLEDATAALLDEVQRRYPDGAPPGAWWAPAHLGGGAPPARASSPSRRWRAQLGRADVPPPADDVDGSEPSSSPDHPPSHRSDRGGGGAPDRPAGDG